MTQSFATVIIQHLDPGARVIWYGQPRQGSRLRLQDSYLIPFSILWCGFATFWEFSVVHTNSPFFFKLWGVPFVCVGLFFVFGRFLVDARGRARTHYGVTNERIVILSGDFALQTNSLSLPHSATYL